MNLSIRCLERLARVLDQENFREKKSHHQLFQMLQVCLQLQQGPFAPLVHLAGGVFEGISSSIFETIEQAKQVDKALSEASESIEDMFLDVLDLEEELAKQRIEAIEDEMDILEQNKDLRLEILRDQWQRGQITGTEYFDQASQINEDYNTGQRALENQDTLITGIGDVITELTGELNDLSGWTKFWTDKDENLEARIATYQQLLNDISSDPDGLTDDEIQELASRYNIEVPAAATGADFVTNGPQLLMVGDNAGGKERVQVSPISSPNLHGPSTGDVHITITGNVYGVDDLYMKLDKAGKRLSKLGRGVRMINLSLLFLDDTVWTDVTHLVRAESYTQEEQLINDDLRSVIDTASCKLVYGSAAGR